MSATFSRKDTDSPLSFEELPMIDGEDLSDDEDDQFDASTPKIDRRMEANRGHRRNRGRHTAEITRSSVVRNHAEDFIGYDNRSSRSVGSEDDSVVSADSRLSLRSSDTTSSIVTALLSCMRTESYIPEVEKQVDILVVPEARLANLIRILLSREREDGVPKEIRDGISLVRRMKEIFTFPMDKAPGWLWRPLFEGLTEGGSFLDIMVVPPSAQSGAQPMPILTWLCQWRSLQKMSSWKGEDELVSMALAAGANPNIKMKNGCTPIFFAVKYGTLETVKLLVKYGAEINLRDNKMRSCLWNAIERPQPEIIAFLLETLPATEAFPYHGKHRKKTSYQTAVDYLFAAQISLSFDRATNRDYPWSWKILGEPSEESVAVTMIEFGQRGATFTPDEITLALLGFVLRGDDSNRRQHRYQKYEEAKLRLERLAQLVVGRWLPESMLEKVRTFHYPIVSTGFPSDSLCRMCHEDTSETGYSQIKLYCGHEFCAKCIVTRSESDEADLFCPLCFKVMSLELTGSMSERRVSLANKFSGYEAPYGPKALTSKQLRMECQCRGIKTMLRNDERLRSMLLNESAYSKTISKEVPIPLFDLNTNVPINNGTDVFLEAPKGGPVVIPIVVKGIPVTAFISTTSCFTLLSPEFVALFQLEKVGLETDEFVNLLGEKVCDKSVSLIDEFRFTLGDIDISLKNSIEIPLPSCIGVQLGLDFLRSGAWCVIDVKLEGRVNHVERLESCVTTDGYGRTFFCNLNQKEELRYYTHDGHHTRIPLLHLQPFKLGSKSNWFSIAASDVFTECSWCCRVFTCSAMIQCPQSPNGFYCTESCRISGAAVRTAKALSFDASAVFVNQMEKRLSREASSKMTTDAILASLMEGDDSFSRI